MNSESVVRLFGSATLSIEGYATGGFHLTSSKGNYKIHVTYTPEDIQSAVIDSETSINTLTMGAQASVWVNIKMLGITVFDDEIGYTNHASPCNDSPKVAFGASVIQFPLRRAINA